MTRYRYVEGNINESTGEAHKIFSNEKIITQSHNYIAQRGDENGVSFKEPKEIEYDDGGTSLASDLAWLSMDVMYRDDDVKEINIGTVFKRHDEGYYKNQPYVGFDFKLEEIEKSTYLGFRCYRFSFKIYETESTAYVFMGTRPNNLFSLTDNIMQAFRSSEQVWWAQKIGRDARAYPNVIFAGHSKGGREAAQAAVEHGSALVYSYNTSIAYLDDQSKIKSYISNGGAMYHFTLPGEVLMMNGANGWNAGFHPYGVSADDVELRNFSQKNGFGRKLDDARFVSRPDGKGIGLKEQFARHTDIKLMLKGLRNGYVHHPGVLFTSDGLPNKARNNPKKWYGY